MAHFTGEVKASDIREYMVVKIRIKGLRPFRFRVILAMWCLAIARKIAPFNIDIELVEYQ